MNERIQELAEQALRLVADEHTDGDESRLNTDSYHVKDLIQEKFAELLVKECIDIALITKAEQLELVSDTEAFDSMPEGAKDHSFGRVVAVNQVVANIKEHFGVEE